MDTDKKGFSLVELMIAITCSLIVLGGITSFYLSQQRAFHFQSQMMELQQRLRSCLFQMEKNIMMAGFDPTGDANAGIGTANATSITFSKDDSGEGTLAADETITYALAGNRVTMNGAASTDNIDALDFVYLDGDSNVLNPARTSVAAASISQIRSVEITIVGRSARPIQGWINNITYKNQQNIDILPVQNDNFIRLRFTTSTKCRNIGL